MPKKHLVQEVLRLLEKENFFGAKVSAEILASKLSQLTNRELENLIEKIEEDYAY